MKRALLALVPLAAACAVEPEVASQSQASSVVAFYPSDAEAPHELELAYSGSGANPGYLVVFLHGGDGNVPLDYTTFLAHAANLGFPVLAISYHAPDQTMGVMCPNSAPADCEDRMRSEIFDGQDLFPGNATLRNAFVGHPTTSIRSRLIDALEQKFSNFLGPNGFPRWKNLIFVGHGGGNAVWISKHRDIPRALSIGPFGDGNTSPFTPASWVDDPSVADAFLLAHQNDPYTSLGNALAIFDAIAPGSSYCVAGTCMNPLCPGQGQYCDSRQLTTSAPKLASSQNEHYDVIMNSAVYAPAWTYMLTHDLPPAP